ncbi:MAG: hypothetical protein EBV03_04915 [Proteobacteria bacterium]|nr:hypothetical protein [Pseudomonadota bacterium]
MTGPAAENANEKPPRRRIENLYVAVDSCAELGGQPYAVLEKLKALYSITGKRKLTVIDTEQGFHEKSNCTIPAYMPMLQSKPTRYAQFLQRNPEWTQVVTTPSCQRFRSDLAGLLLMHAFPLMDAAERIVGCIRHEAWSLMKQRGQDTLDGKRIHRQSDIQVRVVGSEGGNLVFANPLISEAADRAMADWRLEMEKIETLNPSVKKFHKGFMAEMVRAMQDIKANSYAFTQQFDPTQLSQIQCLPTPPGGLRPDLKWLSEHACLFSDTRLPYTRQWWQRSESIQALRLSGLWPWALKSKLTEEAKEALKDIHKNTADRSYLNLFANVMPGVSPPETTLLLVLTHDGPLISQMLECASGVRSATVKKQHRGGGHHFEEVYEPSNIYNELGLTRRKPEEYPYQAAWVGSEFVEFAYKEVLDSLKPYLEKGAREALFDAIRENSPTKTLAVPVYEQLKGAMAGIELNGPLRDALEHLLEETHKLESNVRADIQAYGVVSKEGRYNYRKDVLMQKRTELRIV